LRQVLLNLLSNAVLYTDHGAVTVIARVLDQDLLIVVCDTGRGISQDQIKTIFQPFERVDKHLSASTNGSGLGLAIVKNLVELHHGTCWLESELNIGTSCFIRVPLNKKARVEATTLAA